MSHSVRFLWEKFDFNKLKMFYLNRDGDKEPNNLGCSFNF